MKKQKTEKRCKSTHTHTHTHGYSNRQGITLVALVITIIVLLILAGVAIRAVVGDNGVLKQATKAREEQQYKAEVEKTELNVEYFPDGENMGKVDLAKTQDRIDELDEVESTDFSIDGKLKILFKDGKKHEIDGVVAFLRKEGLKIKEEQYKNYDYVDENGKENKINVTKDDFVISNFNNEGESFSFRTNGIEAAYALFGTPTTEEQEKQMKGLLDRLLPVEKDYIGIFNMDDLTAHVYKFTKDGIKYYKQAFWDKETGEDLRRV